MTQASASECPVHDNIDRRKTADIARRNTKPDAGAHWVKNPSLAQRLLRSKAAFQAGAGADLLNYKNPEQAPVFFLDGKDHAEKRRKSIRFLSPKAISDKHFVVMREATDRLLEQFKREGHAKLEDISFELAVEVVGVILGLTNSDPAGRVRRISWVLKASISEAKNTFLSRLWLNLKRVFFTGIFFYFDVRPAIKERKKTPKDDAISTYIEDGYPNVAIIVECLTYGTAGMLTTREFIIMAAWYLFEDQALRTRFLQADAKDQIGILLEILRLEPVAAMIHRRVDEEVEGLESTTLPAGERYGIDLRDINVNEEFVGECPFAVDPDRAKRRGDSGRYISFGDGPHSCPGWQVALHETRIFLEQFFQIPGIKLDHAPDISWNEMVKGYELRNAEISCDKVS